MRQQIGQTAEIKEIAVATAILSETEVVGAGLASAGPAGPRTTQGWGSERERTRIEAVVETLADLRGGAENLAEVAHDTRNMVTALGLYCDLLEEPGVLSPRFCHYASELRLVAMASRRLVEKLIALDLRQGPLEVSSTPDGLSRPASSGAARRWVEPLGAGRLERAHLWDWMPPGPIGNLAAELTANRNLLSALAGPQIALTVETEGGAQPVRLNGEELTRILVNLVKNAAEAMPAGGRIRLGLRELPAPTGAPADRSSSVGWTTGVPTDRSSPAGRGFISAQRLALTVEDNGPGIPSKALETIFEPGYTTGARGASTPTPPKGGWPVSHRGLGLAITRSIVEAAGGSIRATNRTPAGARFEIELPVGFRPSGSPVAARGMGTTESLPSQEEAALDKTGKGK